MKAWRQGDRQEQSGKGGGDGGGPGEAQRKHSVNGDGANKAQRQCIGNRYSAGGTKATPHVAEGAVRGGGGGEARDRQRGSEEITSVASGPASLVEAEAIMEHGKSGGESIQTAVGPTDLIHMDGLKPSPQGAVFQTRGGSSRGESDDTTNMTAGGGGIFPNQWRWKRAWNRRGQGRGCRRPPHN